MQNSNILASLCRGAIPGRRPQGEAHIELKSILAMNIVPHIPIKDNIKDNIHHYQQMNFIYQPRHGFFV